MARNKVRYVPNHKNVESQILRAPGLASLLERAAQAAAPEGGDIEVSVTQGETRVRASIFDGSWDAMERESNEGHLSRALGRIHT